MGGAGFDREEVCLDLAQDVLVKLLGAVESFHCGVDELDVAQVTIGDNGVSVVALAKIRYHLDFCEAV